MFAVEMQEMSEAFHSCWKAAAIHLGNQVDDDLAWLRSHHFPPFLEHLSFRLGNQLFFVRVEDVDGKVEGPGSRQGLIKAARQANGRACILPMRKKYLGEAWLAELPGWGLLDEETRESIDPVALVTDQKIEMTPWEVHDMAVKIVRDYLVEQGFEPTLWQGQPELDPAIWFIGNTRQPEWIVLRSAKYPEGRPQRPSNWDAIAAGCAKVSTTGHFAAVGLVSAAQPFASRDEPPVPLWRGHAMHVRFAGLE